VSDTPDLHLPKIEGKPLPPSLRTMDEIVEWIEEFCRDFPEVVAYEREHRLLPVNRPFVLR
jgi:hypothetical protein